MALKIRLSRGGAKKRPFYKIVVAEALSPRDGKFIERLGSYNPMVAKDHAERLVLDVERAKYWISKGAQPTLRVAKMLSSDGLVKAPVIREQPIKSAPGKKRLEREAEAAEKLASAEEAPQQKLQRKRLRSRSSSEEAPQQKLQRKRLQQQKLQRKRLRQQKLQQKRLQQQKLQRKRLQQQKLQRKRLRSRSSSESSSRRRG